MARFLALVVLLTGSALAGERITAPQQLGKQTIQIAFAKEKQRYFLLDGKRIELPYKYGYDPVFSLPRWGEKNGEIVAITFWQFDKKRSLRRDVTLAFPRYRRIQTGPWKYFPGTDVIPEPPKAPVGTPVA